MTDLTQHLYYYRATLVRVIDGDTIDVDIDLGFDRITTRRRLRLLGVDTPEHKDPNFAEATEFTSAILKTSSEIIVQTTSKDSFGRWLANVWCNGNSLNAKLIEKGWPR
jgi:micrococcal nuclease